VLTYYDSTMYVSITRTSCYYDYSCSVGTSIPYIIANTVPTRKTTTPGIIHGELYIMWYRYTNEHMSNVAAFMSFMLLRHDIAAIMAGLEGDFWIGL